MPSAANIQRLKLTGAGRLTATLHAVGLLSSTKLTCSQAKPSQAKLTRQMYLDYAWISAKSWYETTALGIGHSKEETWKTKENQEWHYTSRLQSHKGKSTATSCQRKRMASNVAHCVDTRKNSRTNDYNVNVNDIVDCANPGVTVKLFADDTKLYSAFDDLVTPDYLQSYLP